MSLINDALKRAKQAQKQAPPVTPAPSLQLRPVEPESEAQKGSNLFLPGVLALVAVVVVLALVQVSRKGAAPEPVMTRARAAETANHTSEALPAPDSRPAASSSESSGEPSGGSARTAFATPAQTATNPSATPLPNSTNPATVPPPANATSSAPTNPPAPVVAPAPAVPPKLQGIVWDPRRPSAVINGRTLFVGDRFAEFRVRAITPDTVTLASKTQTNLLQLEP